MARRPARMHVHYVHIVSDMYAVEVRQGTRAWTIGKVAGESRRPGAWMAVGITAAQWTSRIRTRREATALLLALVGLEFMQEGPNVTVVPVVKPGDLVFYHGSYAWFRNDEFVVGARDSIGRYELLVPGTGHVELRQVRRVSFTLIPQPAEAPVAA